MACKEVTCYGKVSIVSIHSARSNIENVFTGSVIRQVGLSLLICWYTHDNLFFSVGHVAKTCNNALQISGSDGSYIVCCCVRRIFVHRQGLIYSSATESRLIQAVWATIYLYIHDLDQQPAQERKKGPRGENESTRKWIVTKDLEGCGAGEKMAETQSNRWYETAARMARKRDKLYYHVISPMARESRLDGG